MRGLWAERHLQALANDPKSVGPLVAIVECSQKYQKQHQSATAANDVAKLRNAATRNRVCMCHAVCPTETFDWLSCARAAVKQQREEGADAAAAWKSCDRKRRTLEACTQWESTRLLHAAVLPSTDARR